MNEVNFQIIKSLKKLCKGNPALGENPFVVTGASGFLGFNLVRIFQQVGLHGVGMDMREQPPQLESFSSHENFTFLKGDLSSSGSIKGNLERLPEKFTLVHLASPATHAYLESHVSDMSSFHEGFLDFLKLEKEIFENMTRYFQGRINYVVYISSIDVYGRAIPADKEGAITELTEPQPSSSYGLSKLFGEKLWNCYCIEQNINLAVLRLGHIYGDFEHLFYRRAIPQFLSKGIAGQKIEIYGDGLDRRQYIHCVDIAETILRCLINQISNTYLVVNPNILTIENLASLCLKLTERNQTEKIKLSQGMQKKMYPHVFASENSLKDLGFIPSVDIRDGLKSAIEIMKKIPKALDKGKEEISKIDTDDKNYQPKSEDRTSQRLQNISSAEQKNNSCLITGISGHLGTACLKALLNDKKNDWSIVGIVNRDQSMKRMTILVNSLGDSGQRVRLVKEDLCSPEFQESSIWEDEYDFVIHSAGYIGSGKSSSGSVGQQVDDKSSGGGFTDTNAIATSNLLRAIVCRKIDVGKFVYISSGAVYGRSGILTEDHLLEPNDNYGASKLTGEKIVSCFSNTESVPAIILRVAGIYGPGESLARATTSFIESAQKGKPIHIRADGEQKRNYAYVMDVAKNILECFYSSELENGIQTLNCGSTNAHTVGELANACCRAWAEYYEQNTEVGSESSKIIFNGGEEPDFILDMNKAVNLGLRLETPLLEGIKKQVNWVAAGGNPEDSYWFM